MIRFIHGPRASGKTRHANAFRKAYGCTHIVDDWEVHHMLDLPDGALVLTVEHPDAIHDKFRDNLPRGGIVTTPIATALAQIDKK